MGDNSVLGKAIDNVDSTAKSQAKLVHDELLAAGDNIDSEISQIENDIASLKVQVGPNVAVAAQDLSTNSLNNETPTVTNTTNSVLDEDSIPVTAAAATAIPELETNAPAAAGETTVSQEGDRTIITTSDGAQIDTNVGAGGDEVIFKDPNGEEIRIHGDPHIDFNNDGEDDVHTGDNFQIETSGGSVIHFNTVKEGDDWYTRGVFVEDVNGTVTQVGRSANDQDHISEAKEVEESEISQLGSDANGAAVLGIAADGTGMIKQGDDWHVVEDESFSDFKDNMSFADQIGEKIDPDFVGADTQGVSLDQNPAGDAANVAVPNQAVLDQINSLEGDLQVLEAEESLNDSELDNAAAVVDEVSSETILGDDDSESETNNDIENIVSDDNNPVDVVASDKKEVVDLGQG